ncbi:MAG: phenylalanine--tRNA ligase subunit beta [Lactobacillus sp.]
MLVSYKWLQDFLKVDTEPKALAEKITRTGIEIASTVHPMAGLKKLVVGKVLTCEKVAGTHLHQCTVEAGQDKPLPIVCGAPNVAAGEYVIVALHGAWIAGHHKIKCGKIRGMESDGMICGLQEIGFSDNVVPPKYADGIFVFPEVIDPGTPVYEALGMDDYILDFDITPNRADTSSMEGAAYEVGAILDEKPKIEDVTLKGDGPAWTDDYQVDVDEKLAPKYYLRKIENVKIGESPLWLQTRLWNAGIRPINNVVDATNYAMLLTGQPLHAYDADVFASRKLGVRLARKGEKLTLLNEKELDLDPQDIVITDCEKPVTLAGVMGGANSEVTDQTQNVLLESAVFDPALVRKAALRHANRTDASARFEKGINWDNVQKGLDVAALIMCNHASATVDQGILKATDEQRKPVVITTTISHINKVLGTNLTSDEVVKIFDRLNFATELAGDSITVTVPNRRWDIFIDADLIEEVARIYGYDNLESTQPALPETQGGYSPVESVQRRLRSLMVALGLDETINYSLTNPRKAQLFTRQAKKLVQVDWPMNSDRSTMRQNLMVGLLDTASYNFARNQNSLQIFEEGRVFDNEQGSFNETDHLAALYTGDIFAETWQHRKDQLDFYWVKGQLEALFAALGLKNVSYKAEVIPGMHPTRTAAVYVNDDYVGYVGMLAPSLSLQDKNLRGHDIYGFELNVDQLMPLLLNRATAQAQPAPKFPSMQRDISILVDASVLNSRVIAVLKENGGKYLSDIKVKDVYRGSQIERGKKSLSYQLTFLNKRDTLTEDVVNKAMTQISAGLTAELQAKIR